MTGGPGPEEPQPDSATPETPETPETAKLETPEKLDSATSVKPEKGKRRWRRKKADKAGAADQAEGADKAGAATVVGPAAAADGDKDDNDDKDASSRLAVPGRTLITVAAAIVAVSAIALTTWALAAHGGGDQTATPDDLNTGPVTFGPNQPAETSLGTLPTLPTTPTFPTLPSLPNTSATSLATTFPAFPTTAYTYPTYATSSYTYPSYTPSYTPTSPTTSTTTDPVKTQVYPQTPLETDIAKCGTFGKLQYVPTTGVKYSLDEGDGRQGRWVVGATARKGYVIATGATKKFTGNLGKYHRCPGKLGINGVSATPDESEPDLWRVTVRTSVPDKETRSISVAYSFTGPITLVGTDGEGWTCSDPASDITTVTCTFTGDGRPGWLTAAVQAVDADGDPVAPSGTVSLFADGHQVDIFAFNGSDG